MQCISYNILIEIHRMQRKEYNAWITMHGREYIEYNAKILVHGIQGRDNMNTTKYRIQCIEYNICNTVYNLQS